ncbi:DUF1501 domain-containing protein [Hyphobacterium sp.]|uniref:DUF1501 domain-containing protein n=1 Tax=Hyphobacterium sp. TaxID=2004662 RepID=UPI003BAB1163
MPINRREVLQLVTGASLTAFMPSMVRAQTVGSGGYRAIVTLFLYGGNDSNNAIIPMDGRYTDYASARGGAIAIPQNDVVPLNGTAFGVHPSLAPLAPIWDEGALNWVFNTGPLLQPLTRELYESRPDLRPANLFSHDAQQNLWQTAGTTSELPTGWLGRVGDQLADAGVQAGSVSLSGAQRAMIGQRNNPLLISGSNLRLSGQDPTSTDADDIARRAAYQAMLNATQASTLGELSAAIMRRDIDAGAQLDIILNSDGSAVDAAFVDPQGNQVTGSLADQLRRVARLIEGRTQLNATTQSFIVATGGFDNHRNQAGTHAGLLANVGRCVYAFYNTLKVLGVQNDVALFSMSDFNRPLGGNGSAGSDHAWGGHHFVVGGGLKPNQLLGSFPNLAMGGPDDARTNGRWIPSTSIEEYGGALARWLGVADADMPYVFPNWSTWNGGGRGPVDLFA